MERQVGVLAGEPPRKWRRRLLPLAALFGFGTFVSATTVVSPGTEQKAADIDCGGHRGRVSVNSGVHYREGEADYRNGVSIRYRGTQCADCCWVQFIWREVLVFYRLPAGTAGPQRVVSKSGTIRTTGGSYDLTTDPGNPNYNADSASATSPCYDSAFSGIRTGDSITMYDQPSNAIDRFCASDKTDASVDRIESKAHFDAYLVCAQRVCAKVTWVSTYTWTAAGGTTGPTYDISDVDVSGNAPNDAQKTALDNKYPGQTVLPR